MARVGIQYTRGRARPRIKICGDELPSRSIVGHHLSNKMGTKCPVCGYSIRKHGGIYKHIQDSKDAEHTAYAKGLKRCQTCHVTFKSTQGRSQHIKSCVPTLVQSGYGASGKREFSIRPSIRECQKRACSNDGQLSNKLARGNRTIEQSAFAAQPHVDSQSTPAYSPN